MRESVNEIVACMASGDEFANIQRIQTAHRLKLGQFWGIQKGNRILEIGCGQGDTTAALAYLVGDSGFVHGVDIASPDYGSPITVGDSARFLMNSKIGNRVHMEFEVDLLSEAVELSEGAYDTVVLSHCSWYFSSFEQLGNLLKKVRRYGRQLAFAEWDLRVSQVEQFPHLLAAMIQAQYESYKDKSTANIRTLFTPSDLRTLCEEAGWRIVREDTIPSPELQDGEWEVQTTLTHYRAELSRLESMPARLKTLIESEVQLLREASQRHGMKPMSTYALVAK